MNSKERIKKAVSIEQPDILPVDFGGSTTTGIHVCNVYNLRQYWGLDSKNTPVKVTEPYQMLGEIEDDLREVLGIDVAGLFWRSTFFGFRNENWREWEFHGVPVLVPDGFNTNKNEDGSIFQYAEGDKNYPPCAKLPKGGYFIDALKRQKPFREEDLDPKDNLEEYQLYSKEDLKELKEDAEKIFNNTEYAILGQIGSSGFGDIAFVPGMQLKKPKGIRDETEWYISTLTRRDYLKSVFSKQCEISIENYNRINNTIGEMLDIMYITGTDFGMQNGLITSIEAYRDLYKPFHLKVNKWIHENTGWKTFIHSCGSVVDLIPEFIEAGFDILNPVQISAKGMNPLKLKSKYGKYITFWGGGVDTQKVLSFGTPDDVREDVKRNIEIFFKNGGFVFSSVHNVMGNVPLENLIAMFEVIHSYRNI
ncbi:hypothetical protein ES705_35701 [subsurface metagenome]